ncbi:MAG: aminopeptidase P family protein [Alphaproteobacteria bacterium]|nr:MAG: aminopeptidase P family protein [Alphaproteobacteria bacterium]
MTVSKINHIRTALKDQKSEGIIIPKWDEFRSEFVEPCDDYLNWATNFTGSYGVAVITQKDAVLFVDGRYTIQAKDECKRFEILDINQLKSWICANTSGKIVFDPWLFTNKEIETYKTQDNTFHPVEGFFDELWPMEKRKKRILPQITYYPLSGQNSFDKRLELGQTLESHDYVLVTDPESVSWLLNIRDTAREFTPVVNGYALVNKEGSVELFADGAYEDMFENVLTFSKAKLIPRLKKLKKHSVIISASASFIISDTLKKHVVQSDTIRLKKARKNTMELQYMRLIHRRDGAALSEFLTWLSTTEEAVTELTASDILLQFRQLQRQFLQPSFPTIAGAKENSAIIHYRPTKKTNKTVENGDVFLVDSGGQYWGGTTDVTRTIVKGGGQYATHTFKEIYTAVLKGVIALSSCVFKKGTTGHQLDCLARMFLWELGLDYPHGTGHGVGAFLNVHEGPQSISSKPNNVALEEGMVLSVEPGYYQEGAFGIRLENLVCVVPSEEHTDYLTFETLTYVPFEPELINFDALTEKEKKWLRHYHSDLIMQNIYSLVSDDCYDWLSETAEKFRDTLPLF